MAKKNSDLASAEATKPPTKCLMRSIELHIPELCSRLLDHSRQFRPSKLTISFISNRNEHVALIAKMMLDMKPAGSDVYLTSIGEFLSLNALLSVQSASDIECSEGVALARSAEGIKLLLEEWDAECIVIVIAQKETGFVALEKVRTSETKFWKLAKPGYEAPYLEHLQLFNLVLFYSPSRVAVDIFGRDDVVRDCYQRMESCIPC